MKCILISVKDLGKILFRENYDMSVIDHFEQVTDKDGAIMARRLAKEEGFFAAIVPEVVCRD